MTSLGPKREIKYIEGAPCTYCGGTNTVSIIPDKHPLSPWECLDCGAAFGSDRTDLGLLSFYAHGPIDRSAVADLAIETCVRCGKDLSDPEEFRHMTDKGQVCDDCTPPDEW